MPKVRKIPERMCIGCQEMKPKKTLIRVVRTPEETIEVDRTGKRSGRGAYICPNEECLDKALKGKRLEKALKHAITEEIKESLLKRVDQP
ncbi:RNase P modulator RnpM [Desulfoscipio gibsoniae]|uniref:Putative nucleic-acid-binding protein implicated in transcription termination n=1 Tax=Desulfoscipio gibsoniae DSM 7213 TaxID=767817 RepID=R4KL84_9FIRM|nr:YlxR family protein [Desulfoscipio gibsoniae]AGL01290.1 putative nucleic-acid-binding protein implicated in transcription termination [Desulfoscipio gibsoniae DSM 7213]